MKQLSSDIKELCTDEDIARVFTGTNFGAKRDNRQIIADTLLKIAGDYFTGHTALMCCRELGLLTNSKHITRLTKKGRRYLFWAFHNTRACA